ncbi:MAG: pantothenate kinase [Bacteroidetes bacterium 4572_77]|nr:MAG: pantothenate kinase [Bacteroidetes bacterium 4572_77]
MGESLILDFGNTLKKAAVYRGETLLEIEADSVDILEIIKNFQQKYPLLSSAILSSVIHVEPNVLHYLENNFRFIHFDAQTPIPIINKYHTPQTLGLDRLAAAIGAYNLFPKKNTLVIDMGSSITYEFINEKKEYIGGAISPGLYMRAKALHEFTAKLPYIEPKTTETPLVGKTTQESIKSGVINACIAEMDGMINEFKNNYDDLCIILTGGDAFYFEKRLKNNIFASRNLVLEGLNHILKFNEH